MRLMWDGGSGSARAGSSASSSNRTRGIMVRIRETSDDAISVLYHSFVNHNTGVCSQGWRLNHSMLREKAQVLSIKSGKQIDFAGLSVENRTIRMAPRPAIGIL